MTFLFIPVEAAEARGRGKIALFRRGANNSRIAFPRGARVHEGGSADCFFTTMLSNREENFCLATFSVRHRARYEKLRGYKRNFIADPTIVPIPATLCVISTSQRSLRNFINNESTFFTAVEILSLRTKNVLKGYSLPQFYYYILQCLLSFACFAQFQFIILLKIYIIARFVRCISFFFN